MRNASVGEEVVVIHATDTLFWIRVVMEDVESRGGFEERFWR